MKKTPFEVLCDSIITICWAVICCCLLYIGCQYGHQTDIMKQKIEMRK